MSALRDRLLKNSTIAGTAMLADSEIYNRKQTDWVTTEVPMINVAFSGDPDGGMSAGVTQIAGPSKHFKTGFSLLLARSFLKKHPDGIILFYDSEFGSPASYFSAFDVNPDQVVHSPIESIEALRHDLVTQLEHITDKDKVLILIDSLGNTASVKETEDATKDSTSPADFTRAKTIKSFFRIVTTKLVMKNIPMVVINHVYMTMEKFSKAIASGGTGSIYNSDNIWIVGRSQDKEGDELTGYNFNITVQKSRYVKEGSKIPITVTFEDGIERWSGLFDQAKDAGLIEVGLNEKGKPSAGWYVTVDPATGVIDPTQTNRRRADIEEDDTFWKKLLETKMFKDYLSKKYKLGNGGKVVQYDVSAEDDEE
jgi:RecA/RadA recombinase